MKFLRRNILLACCLFSLSISLLAGLAIAGPTGKLIIFHAGSLAMPFAQMEKEFEAKNPGVDIQRESGGSTKLARMISDSGKPADIMASADYAVIDKTLIPKEASWNVRFASNQMVLCFTEKSKFAEAVSVNNWYEILGRAGVSWGHSDPNLDPAGYRALMVLQLAQIHYKMPDLLKKLLENRPQDNIRPKAAELVTLLKEGKMDYAWEYLSVAVQNKLKYVKLPNEINLGDIMLDDFYKQARVEVTGDKPGTMITRTGASITYGLTIVKSAPNPDLAVSFLQYMMNPEGGLKILEESGQPPFNPCWVPTEKMREELPAPLRSLVVVKDR